MAGASALCIDKGGGICKGGHSQWKRSLSACTRNGSHNSRSSREEERCTVQLAICPRVPVCAPTELQTSPSRGGELASLCSPDTWLQQKLVVMGADVARIVVWRAHDNWMTMSSFRTLRVDADHCTPHRKRNVSFASPRHR